MFWQLFNVLEYSLVDLQDGVDGDGYPDDRLGAVERWGRDQTIVGGLDHQLAASHLGKDDKDKYINDIL